MTTIHPHVKSSVVDNLVLCDEKDSPIFVPKEESMAFLKLKNTKTDSVPNWELLEKHFQKK